MSLRRNTRAQGRVCGHLAAAGLLAALVAVAVAGSHSAPTGVNVLVNTPDRIVLEYGFPPFTTTDVAIDGQAYLQIGLPDEPTLLVAGAPELPHVARSLIIPDDGTLAVRVLGGDYQDYTDIDVAPSKGNLLRTVDPASVPFSFGPVYEADAFYPGQVAELGEPFILRDYRGVVVDVHPIQYNPVSRTLRVYETLTVEVTRVGDGGLNVLENRHERELSLSFHNIYSARFLNYEPDFDYPPVGETGDMLVICHDAWISNMMPFVDHKNSAGIPTTIVGVSTIGNNATAIKSYIQNVYNTSDLAFVLLVGDSGQVATPSASGGASDPSYTKLAGGDNWPDIIIGRFSCESPAQVDLHVLKTLEYEQNYATQEDWFWKGMGIASSQGAGQGDEGQADNVHIDEIRTWLMAVGYTEVDRIYEPSANKTMVTNGVNAGRGIINYCGHGSTTSWSTTGFSNSDVALLVNDNQLPFIVSVACVNGKFNNATCFAEAWLRASNNSTHEPTGAVAMYASSVNQSWAPPMEGQDEFNLLLCAKTYNTYGALCFNGSCSMMEDYGGDGVEMFDTWHIFGDPSLRVVGTIVPPSGLYVSPRDTLHAKGQAGGPFSPDYIDYVLENRDPTPLDYEVRKTENWVVIEDGQGTIPPLSTVSVRVKIGSAANFMNNGLYSDTIEFVNLTNHDGDTEREVLLEIGVPSMQLAWTFDSDPQWNLQGQWAFGKPTGQGGDHGSPDPTTGKTGDNVYGYNLNGDYANNMPEYHLTSTPIDCSELKQVSVRFYRWLGVERNLYDHAYFRVSTDGTNWVEVWKNPDEETADGAWKLVEYDISAIADNQPTVYLRWSMGTTDVGWTYCGWNIDDVELWGLPPANLFPLGDLNCDGILDFLDINPFVLALTDPVGYGQAYPDCNQMLADCNEDGKVDFADINPFIDRLLKP